MGIDRNQHPVRHAIAEVERAGPRRGIGKRLGRIGKHRGGGVIGGPVAPFAGQFDTRHQSDSGIKFRTGCSHIGYTHHTAGQRTRFGFGFGGGVDITGVGRSLDGHPQRGIAAISSSVVIAAS